MAGHGLGHAFRNINVGHNGRAHLGDIYQSKEGNPLDRLPHAGLASFNSFRCDPDKEAECLSGTRNGVLSQIQEWVDGPSQAPIFWLKGMVGRGKSTISRTIARTYHGRKQLGASFFFSRGISDLSQPAKFFPTVAVQLASSCPSLGAPIARAVEGNKNIANETLRDQWNTLIFQPLLGFDPEHNPTPSPLVVVVDALDECESDHAIVEILRLLSEATVLTTFKLRILITSRPETSIAGGFRAMTAGTYESLALDHVPRDVVDRDIDLFLRRRFRDIALASGNPSTDWPDEAAIAVLVRKAAGLFIYAATICRFIQRKRNWSPRKLLAILVPDKQSDMPRPGTRRSPCASPTAELDTLYLTILQQSMADIRAACDEEEETRYFRLVFGSLALLHEPLSTTALANLLSEDEDDIYAMLCPLRSVLHVPEKRDEAINLLHPSFREFLISEDRCEDARYRVDRETTHQLLVDRCLGRLMDNERGLRKEICNLRRLGIRSKELDAALKERLFPRDMQYACVYWIHHLIAANTPVRDGDLPRRFLAECFQLWLEALSIIRMLDGGVEPRFDLNSVVTARHGPNTMEFAQDAKRFIQHSLSMIGDAPLQIYYSALVFCPKNHFIRGHFVDQIPTWIKRSALVERDWNPCLQALKLQGAPVGAVAFSPDSRVFAFGSWDSTVKLWDLATATLKFTLRGHWAYVTSLSFSPNGHLLASASEDGSIMLWNPVDGTPYRVLTSTSYAVSRPNRTSRSQSSRTAHVRFSPDGGVLASAFNNKITLWSPTTGTSYGSLNGHTDVITALCFSPDGKLFASASQDCTAVVWDSATGLPRGYLDLSARSIAFSPANSRLLSLAVYGVRRRNVREVQKVLWKRNRGKSSGVVPALGFSPAEALPLLTHSDGHMIPEPWEPVFWDSLVVQHLCLGCLGLKKAMVILLDADWDFKSGLTKRTSASMLSARLLRFAGFCCRRLCNDGRMSLIELD